MRKLLLLAALAACAGPQLNVKPSDAWRAVKTEELRFNDNIFKVTVRTTTSEEGKDAMVEQFALLQSAEVARAHGFRYFAIGRRWASKGGTACGPALPSDRSGESCTATLYSASNIILCFKEQPVIDRPVYEASRVIEAVQSTYELNEAVVAR